MTDRLLILACSATKRHDAGWMPAIDRYNGPLWQTLRAVDPTGQLAMSAYLSARYGFGPSLGPMDNYDARLTPELAKWMIEGGLETRWPRPPTRKAPDSFGMHAGCQIASMTHYRTRPFRDVALVGGAIYLEVMRAFVHLFRIDGHITEDARIVEINAPIGIMRQRMTQWLQESSHGISDRPSTLHPDRAADLLRDHPPVSRTAVSADSNRASLSPYVRIEDLKLGEHL